MSKITVTGQLTITGGQLTASITPGPFSANAVNFDGTNDYLTRGAGLTGQADGKKLIISVWVQRGADGGEQHIISNTGATVHLRFNPSQKIDIRIDQISGVAWNANTTNTFPTASTDWLHLLLGMDTVTSKRALYVNDVLQSVESESFTADSTVDMTRSDWSIGSSTSGSSKFNGDMAEVYYTDEFLDFAVEENRRLFIDADGKPVDLGSDGSTPTTNIPLVFFSGDTSTWHTNDGDGGGFTETGDLTTASTSPSD